MIVLLKQTLTNFCIILMHDKRFKLDPRVMLVRDLNFVLRSEIFINSDGQLRESHLILGCTPVYTTWQPFGPALLVDNPLLSYIDVRLSNLFPP